MTGVFRPLIGQTVWWTNTLHPHIPGWDKISFLATQSVAVIVLSPCDTKLSDYGRYNMLCYIFKASPALCSTAGASRDHVTSAVVKSGSTLQLLLVTSARSPFRHFTVPSSHHVRGWKTLGSSLCVDPLRSHRERGGADPDFQWVSVHLVRKNSEFVLSGETHSGQRGVTWREK